MNADNADRKFQFVMNNMDSLLSVTASERYAKVHSSLWVTLNEDMCFPECEIYSYDPDLISGSVTPSVRR